MILLWYLVALGMQRLYPGEHPLRRLLGYGVYADWMEQRLEPLGLPVWLSSLLIFLLPALLAWFLLAYTFGALHILVCLVLVVYAVDTGRLDLLLERAGEAAPGDERAEILGEAATDEFHSLHRYLFWLLLAGPFGMLLVRLLQEHRQWELASSATEEAAAEQDETRATTQEETEATARQQTAPEQPGTGQDRSLPARLLYLADWLSGRLAGLLLALVTGGGALAAWAGLAAGKESGLKVFSDSLLAEGPASGAVKGRLNRLLLVWALLFLLTTIWLRVLPFSPSPVAPIFKFLLNG